MRALAFLLVTLVHQAFCQSYNVLNLTQLTAVKSRGGLVDVDGNRLLVFVEQAGYPSDWDVCLARLDQVMQVMWSKRYRIQSSSEDVVGYTEYGDYYYIVGSIDGGVGTGTDGLIMKVNKQTGNTTSFRFGGSMGDTFTGILPYDSSLIVCGHSKDPTFLTPPSVTNRGDGVIVSLDPVSLDTLRTLRLGRSDRFDKFEHLTKALDNGLVIVGTCAPFLISSPWHPTDNEDVIVHKIDSLWALKWTKVLNHSAVSLYEYPTGVDVSSQGDIYVSVHPMTYSGGVVHRISPSGAIKSSRLISGVPRSVLVSDTNLFVCGYAGNQGFVTRMMLGLGHVSTKSHTFGSNSSAGFWKLHAGGSGLQGFGFAYGNTRPVATEMDLSGGMMSCGDNPLSLSIQGFVPDTSRMPIFMKGHFPAIRTSLITQEISLVVSQNLCENIVMPIELVSFRAFYEEGRHVNVSWDVASQTGISRFIVERSYDGMEYSAVYETSAISGFDILYEWQDLDLKPGLRYYRLKAVDNGATETLADVSVMVGSFMADVYPNPARKGETLSGGPPGEVWLYDLKGNLVSTGGSISSLALPEASSVYLIRFSDGTCGRLMIE